MIRVAITQREAPDMDIGEARDALDIRWHRLLQICGIVATPLPNDPRLAMAHVVAFGCCGLILTGGGALTLDGGPRSEREATEAALYEWALEKGLPVLGVCRGMQFLAVSAGGRLEEVSAHLATRHEIMLANGVRTVNSYHRLAVIDMPDDFEVLARAGPVIEAISHREGLVVGIMWHPERETPFDPADVALLRGIFCRPN